ncbi:histone acetyltransferase p300-like isoform X2 [Acanthaster planci]|uniref:Histone acetyltransferase p300-like isoform X2 n=1 Tax=Acanthaster planci TaxID=133434 RepID=A0A8B7ZUY6_ACAPL|nr:histone acetyltransferase p300-like isoform X2 [Acanthaster planci]
MLDSYIIDEETRPDPWETIFWIVTHHQIFATANTTHLEEHYHLLVDKIYKIQKELQQKQQKRMQDSGGTDAAAGGILTMAAAQLSQPQPPH